MLQVETYLCVSQRTLRLRLFYTHGTPVFRLKVLDYWPTLPIVVQYGGSLALSPPAPEDEDNIMAALKQSDRVNSINLTVTSSLLENLSAIERPFSQLEDLVLLFRDGVRRTLPRAFRWGPRLRCLHSTRVAFPALLHLLYSSRNLVDLQLHEVVHPLHFSPEALTDTLSGMIQLRSLSLHLLTTVKYTALDLPHPPSGERLVARIDAPRLGDIEVTLFNLFIFDPSKLGEFIDRIETQKSPLRANTLSSKRTISISITQPEAHARLKLEVSCKPLTRQLSHMAQICNGLSAFLLGHLRISATRPPRRQDKSDLDEWAGLIFPKGAKWVHVAGDHLAHIMRALQLSHKLLPALHKLCMAKPGPCHAPLMEAVVSFVASRRLSGHSMAVEYEQPCRISELHGTGTIYD
ncbi:hypothetical protein EDB83DRAFT_2593538 [Lactarius deliciosus]|nr:hypothetical protein EDB83DRAFT_2593538 [Lactarius deliciosus]